MDDKIIGIEVAGLTYGLKDEETATEAEQAKRKADTAEEAAEAASSAVTEQAERIAQIEANIGDNDISEIASNASSALEGATEAGATAENALAQVDSLVHNIEGIPRFTLEVLRPVAKQQQPTIAQPIVVWLQGPCLDTSCPVDWYSFSLVFYDDAICLKAAQTYVTVSGQPDSFYVGWTFFRVLKSYIVSELKKKYPTRTEEIDDYVNNKMSKFVKIGQDENPMSLLFMGEDDTQIYAPQIIYGEKSNGDVWGFIFQVMPTISVNWDSGMTKTGVGSSSSHKTHRIE